MSDEPLHILDYSRTMMIERLLSVHGQKLQAILQADPRSRLRHLTIDEVRELCAKSNIPTA